MGIEAKVIADSISAAGKRLTTLQLRYPRFIHSEVMTHRVFSRNASSSRAIPVAKMLEQVRTDPAMPVHWGKNQPGMQAHEELEGNVLELVKAGWQNAAAGAALFAEAMEKAGLHKQVANRLLEPFQFISVIVTATEWANFFELRDHPDAQPEIRILAVAMKDAMMASEPKLLGPGEWHLPYVSDDDLNVLIPAYVKTDAPGIYDKALDHAVLGFARQISAARCARVSYLTHDGLSPDIDKDITLYERLVGGRPLHASPIEHQATPDGWSCIEKVWHNPHLHGNFVGWKQNRKFIEQDFVSKKG